MFKNLNWSIGLINSDHLVIFKLRQEWKNSNARKKLLNKISHPKLFFQTPSFIILKRRNLEIGSSSFFNYLRIIFLRGLWRGKYRVLELKNLNCLISKTKSDILKVILGVFKFHHSKVAIKINLFNNWKKSNARKFLNFQIVWKYIFFAKFRTKM